MEVLERPSTEIRTANDWINESKKRPIPKPLFGEFWREGEIAVMFADIGKGASAFGMQIAQSVASGKKINPFQAAAQPQNVLYLDLEMNEKQFEARYAADHDGSNAKFLRKHFVFSDNLIREELDPADFWVKGERTCDLFRRKLRYLVKQADANVVVIDSLTCLKRSYYGSREILDLVTAIKKLQREMNISILAIVQTQKQSDPQPLSMNSLRGMKLLCGRVDSVFGIGQSRFDNAERFIKRVKSLDSAIDFDAMHVPTFRLKKLGGNFLGFEFKGFMPEIELVSDIRASKEWNMIEKIKQMSEGDDAMSIRAIAAEINLPKTTVHRLLQMWRPEVEHPTLEEPEHDDDPTKRPNYFPGCEEYIEALDEPRFDCLFEKDEDDEDFDDHQESDEYRAANAEADLIEEAQAEACEEYEKTGKVTGLAEMLERLRKRKEEEEKKTAHYLKHGIYPDSYESTIDDFPSEPSRPVTHKCLPQHEELLKELEYSYDHNDNEIFVEKKNDHGKPIVWYNYDAKGRLFRVERDDCGSRGKQIDGPPPVL